MGVLVKAMRQAYSYYHKPRKKILESAKQKLYLKKKDGSPSEKYIVKYLCNICGKLTHRPEVDHIIPIGKQPKCLPMIGWDDWLNRLFCPIENLQVLCEACHNLKTGRERVYGFRQIRETTKARAIKDTQVGEGELEQIPGASDPSPVRSG